MLKFKLDTGKNPSSFFRNKLRLTAKAVTNAITEATDGIVGDLKRDTSASGLGISFVKSWRRKIFINPSSLSTKRFSLDTTGFVYTKSEKVLFGFATGANIFKKEKRMAIPLRSVKDRFKFRALTPENFIKNTGKKLFVVNRRGVTFLATNSDIKGEPPIFLFHLVDEIKLPKLLSVERIGDKWHKLLPNLIEKHIDG